MGLYVDNELATICKADNGFVLKLKNVEAEAAAEKKRAKTDKYVPTPGPAIVVCQSMGQLQKVLKERLPDIAMGYEAYADEFAKATVDAKPSKY